MTVMNNISKQFAVSVTSFKDKQFLFARLKLTISFTLGMLIILVVFNLLVFGLFVKNLPDHLETPHTEQVENRLENVLYIADGIILIFVALTSYYLSGFALRPIEKSYNLQRRFIADAAHELRTPLAVMKTGSESVLSGKSNKEDYKKIVSESIEEIDYLSTMVDDLLFLAQSDNLQQPKFIKFDLSTLVRKNVELMRPYAKSKEVLLKENVKSELYMYGNKDYFKRLLINLIHNAIVYNKPNGTVTVSLRKKDDKLELEMADTGIGISEEDLKHVFDRFYKADQARVKKSGVGLGLSIVKEIVDLHQAQISIKSETGKGTAVIIFVPLS